MQTNELFLTFDERKK